MPELPDDLATRLSSFGTDVPVGLPGAAAARRRGAQRTRRTRIALAGGGATALGVAAVLGGSLDGGGRDRVSIPAATPAPAPPPPQGPVDPFLEDALLDADDVGAALGGRWSVRPPQDDGDTTSPLPQDCAEPFPVRGPDAVRRSFGPDDGVEQVLVRYPDVESATAAFTSLVAVLGRCPAGTPTSVLHGLPESGPVLVFGERLGPEATVPFALGQHGTVVSAVSAPTLSQLPTVAAAVRREVLDAVSVDPDRYVELLPGPPDLRAALLTPSGADRVLPGQWGITSVPDGGREVPFLPCGAGPAPNAAGDDRVSSDVVLGTGTGEQRTSVRQEVEQYAGPTTAARAYDLVRERVGTCPETSLPAAEGPGTVVTEVVDEQDEGGVRTLLVREVATCEGCRPDVSWFAVQQAGDLLSALRVDEPASTDGRDTTVRRFARLVADELSTTG